MKFLITALWGRGFADLFLRVAVRSLLSEGNVGAFAARHAAVHSIFTTEDMSIRRACFRSMHRRRARSRQCRNPAERISPRLRQRPRRERMSASRRRGLSGGARVLPRVSDTAPYAPFQGPRDPPSSSGHLIMGALRRPDSGAAANGSLAAAPERAPAEQAAAAPRASIGPAPSNELVELFCDVQRARAVLTLAEVLHFYR